MLHYKLRRIYLSFYLFFNYKFFDILVDIVGRGLQLFVFWILVWDIVAYSSLWHMFVYYPIAIILYASYEIWLWPMPIIYGIDYRLRGILYRLAKWQRTQDSFLSIP